MEEGEPVWTGTQCPQAQLAEQKAAQSRKGHEQVLRPGPHRGQGINAFTPGPNAWRTPEPM